MVTVAVDWLAIAPRDALKELPLLFHVPRLTDAVENVSPEGNESATTTLLAASGPRFVIVNAIVTLLETLAAAGKELLMARSATFPEQQEKLLIDKESMYQPTLPREASVEQRQRS